MSKRQIAQAVELYESFREAKPRRLKRLNVTIPRVVACMGHVEGIDYRTTHGKKVTLYHHDFAPGSRPLLCVSANGRQLLLLGGMYKWDDRGIVDKDKAGRDVIDSKHGEDYDDSQESMFLRRQANPAKFDRCVKAVKRKGTAANAYAVCAAAGTRNPKAMSVRDPEHAKLLAGLKSHFISDEAKERSKRHG